MLNLLLFLVAVFLFGVAIGVAFASRRWRTTCEDWKILYEAAAAAAEVHKKRAESLKKMLDESIELVEKVLAKRSPFAEEWDRDDRRV